jgi:DNA gyrase subunit A
VREFQEGRYVVFATKKSTVKKTDVMAYANPQRSGIIAISLDEGDEVIGVRCVRLLFGCCVVVQG